jgi:hypothetical protein
MRNDVPVLKDAPHYLRVWKNGSIASRICNPRDLACWPLVPKFAGSNPAEAVGFFRAKKSSARLPSEGKQNRGSYVVDLRHVKDP